MEEKDERKERPKGFTVIDKRFWVKKEEGEESKEEEKSTRYPTYVEELLAKLEEKEKQLNEYISAYRRVKLESEEFQKRLSKDFEKRVEIMKGNIIKNLLPLLDNFERALNSTKDTKDFDGFFNGVKMIYSQFLNILKNDGVERLERVGKVFDPNLDEAIDVVNVENEEEDNVVVDEFEGGYMLNGKLLRPAKVRVGRFINRMEEEVKKEEH